MSTWCDVDSNENVQSVKYFHFCIYFISILFTKNSMFYFIGYSFYRTTLYWLTLACIFRLSIHVVKHVEKKKVCQFSLLKIYPVFVDKSCCWWLFVVVVIALLHKINMSQFVFNFHTFMNLLPHSWKFSEITYVARNIC